jgi:hypothetical protein
MGFFKVIQQALAECKPKQKNSSIVGSLLEPADRTKSAGLVSTENLPSQLRPYHLTLRSLPRRPDLTLHITNLNNELRRAQLDIIEKEAKITELERQLSEEYERPTREEPRNSSPVLRWRRGGSPPQRLRKQFQSLQQENESLKRRLQELHGFFEREKQMEVEGVWETAANGDRFHREDLKCMRAEMRRVEHESSARLNAVRQETELYIAKIRESHQAELQQQRQTSEATLAQRETRIAELEEEIQEKTARIADTRLVLDQTRNAERQRAIRAAEELAERDRRFEFIQQECARMAAGGR